MHYWSPRGVLKIEPVESFLSRHPTAMVTRVAGSSIEFTPDSLPKQRHIYVLEQSR
jgi:hypothetical protein